MRFRSSLLAALVLSACTGTDFNDIEFVGTMTVTPLQTQVGGEVTVTLDAEGPRLLSFLVDYGDGSTPDFRGVAGSQTARSTTTHVYEEAGVFEVTGRIDEISDTIVRMAMVTVVAPSSDQVPAVFMPVRR
jgi:hypothetical protein